MTGITLAIIGAMLAVVLAGIGSILGVAIAGSAGAGVIADDPEKFGKVLILEALPGSQGIYGFLGAFLIMLWFGFIGGTPDISPEVGMSILYASLPVALSGLMSGWFQGKVAASGMNVVAKQPADAGKAIVLCVMVETYAILGLLITVLLLLGIKG